MLKVSKITGERIEKRILTFLKQPIPSRCQYLVKQSDAYLNLKNFEEDGWAKFNWAEESDWNQWEAEIERSLEKGNVYDPLLISTSELFHSKFWQNFNESEKTPEIETAKKYLLELSSLTISLQQSLVERFSSLQRRTLYKRFNETEMTVKEFAEQ